MSLQDDIKQVLNIKKDLFKAINEKGVELQHTVEFNKYADKIRAISAGGKSVTKFYIDEVTILTPIFNVADVCKSENFTGIEKQTVEFTNTSNTSILFIKIVDGGDVKLDIQVQPNCLQEYELNTSTTLEVYANGSYNIKYNLFGF